MAVRLKDIAEHVGVDPSTVSYVLNKTPKANDFSEETRNKIVEAAQKLGYHPNAAARALMTKRNRCICFILADNMQGGLTNIYFARILSGVEAVCNSYDYGLRVGVRNITDVEKFVYPQEVVQKSVDGIVLAGWNFSADIIDKFKSLNMPCVCMGEGYSFSKEIVGVYPDLVKEYLPIVSYAGKKGYRKISIACPVMDKEIWNNTINELLKLGNNVQITPFLIDGDIDFNSALPIIDKYLAMPPAERPDLLVTSDQSALALLKEFKKKGIRCPEDIALVSNVNNFLCEYSDPPLSALEFKFEKIGSTAAEMLIKHLENNTPLKDIVFRKKSDFSLIERDSS